MKAVQVMFDESMLAELDKTSDVRTLGRSAVLRLLTSEYLERQRCSDIDDQYERAYANVSKPLGLEFEGWEDEGVWPSE
jgi:metal-responsive CopG/Arc/MetJ family transcriptional regulator